jgi:hypothetical protein
LQYDWKAAILIQLRRSRQNRRRCWTQSPNTTSRIHFKNGTSDGNGAYIAEGNFFEGEDGQ